MTDAFGPSYAAAYDALYAEKDYDAECDFLEDAFARSGRTVRSVLDLGCGTGAHANRLAVRGYEVVGIDLSSTMLDIARRASASLGKAGPTFVQGDIRTARLDRQFDAVICMFAVLGYQTADQDVASALGTVRSHLEDQGPFVFDVWYGPAVEAIGPSTRSRVVADGGGEIERTASAVLDRGARICTVSYRLVSRRPGHPDQATDEVHRMRYFFREELEAFLREARLEPQGLRPFPDTTAPLTPAEWNVVGTAKG